MGRYILRRLGQAVFTVFGVMLLTFLLFRVIAGDVSANYVNPKLGREARVAWLRKHKLDLPLLVNLDRRLVFEDHTAGTGELAVRDGPDSRLARGLGLEGDGPSTVRSERALSALVGWLSPRTPLGRITGPYPWTATRRGRPPEASGDTTDAGPGSAPTPNSDGEVPASAPAPALIFELRDGGRFPVDISPLLAVPDGKATCGQLLDLLNGQPDNRGRVTARIAGPTCTGPLGRRLALRARGLLQSQFFLHLWDGIRFEGRSYQTEETLTDTIARKAGFSLAITVPALALGWLTGMVVSCFVAYYRDTWIDRAGVFLSVLGMCIPYLAYMILGQWATFMVFPEAAWGLRHRPNVYLPVGISVVAGLGGSVRFYRTIILDQIHSDYVRTARAKGAPLTAILFRHVIKNCMLPILTHLVMAIPFLILGSLLLERFFGVPGLGDLMISSISSRDVPIISGLTYLTALVYVLGLIVTDLLYAVFDPRIRLT